MSAAANNNNNHSNPILSYFIEWSDKTSCVTRNIMITLFVCLIISFFFPASENFLGNIPQYTIFKYQLYRLLCSPLVGNSLLNIILVCLFFPSIGGRLESSVGSASYLSLIILLTLFTSILFSLLCVVVFYSGVIEAIFYCSSGFWIVLFGLITIECWQVSPCMLCYLHYFTCK